ncbi:MAG: hypothetical protein JSS51_09265 [Planctomycetes bacterium]|nr:hypothetical protein [Planctomycetota bacterium]
MSKAICSLIPLFVLAAPSQATTTLFFNPSQVATPVSSGVTSETISSNGYRFTLTRDKLFTGGTGTVIGRTVRIPWPQGIEAQAVTTPPPGGTSRPAQITIQRDDGGAFDLKAFTAHLLANTAATGASIEIMPLLDGEDAFRDPLYFLASGYYGSTFSYDETPNYWGCTALLKGYDTYKVTLFVDFAFTALTLSVPGNTCPADLNADTFVDDSDFVLFASAYDLLDCADPQMTPGCPADLTGDAMVDDSDFVVFAAAYDALLCP